MDPNSFVPSTPRAPERAPSPYSLEPFEPRPATDFERQADDIIANFRARQGMPIEKKKLVGTSSMKGTSITSIKGQGGVTEAGGRMLCSCFTPELNLGGH
ncbi:hypothetical protein Pmani_031871 [Petrolisthes manimaculis]|uniref:Uncharacterized protein n=1 Tax=Petrolisthes manimaculis TaxID=1843537 RepID=A0AAE1NU67_9EUCA|nr:hypothetical protein Pmani_031871 [Petrolisthes manimaculis]